MKRIDTSTRAVNLFGAGKDGFKDGDLANGIVPTDFNAAWPNGVQEEILTVIEKAGIAPAGGNLAQLMEAIKKVTASRLTALISSGNFVVPADVYSIDAEIWGGGGGGGGVGSTTNGSAGGGGGGGYSRATIAVTPGQVLAATIGGAGAAGVSGNAGSAGGTTTFGGLTATGGAGGSANSIGSGGAGGTGSGGLINAVGGSGSGGLLAGQSGAGGPGGGSPYGGPGGGGALGSAGSGVAPGGGGGGPGSSTIQPGAAGARGQVNIRY